MQRAADAEVTAKARIEARIVLTFDLDFGEILALDLLIKSRVAQRLALIDRKADVINRAAVKVPAKR